MTRWPVCLQGAPSTLWTCVDTLYEVGGQFGNAHIMLILYQLISF